MKKTIIAISCFTFAAFCLGACNGNKTTGSKTDSSVTKTAAAPAVIEIIGKTGTISFPQFKVDETFISDSTLHWKIVDEKGMITEADEKIKYKKINDHQFFVNWIEKTGLAVSQILDPKNGTATAFVSRADEKSDRGGRSANFFEGSFKVKN